MWTLTRGLHGALSSGCHGSKVPCRSRQQLTIVCRYDLRKSANNVEERRKVPPKGSSAAERSLTPEQLKAARASVVYQRAYLLCGGTKGQLSLQMCLFLFTEQPQLLELSTDLLAARISSLSQVLGIPVPDAAELLVRCGALIDVLPLRLNSTAESLSVALQIPKPQALVMLAADINLLDTPPLRVKQQVDVLASVLGCPAAAVAAMVAGCPHILKVEAPAVQIRWINLQSLLQLNPVALLRLLQQEPRLLMPSSQNLTQNHAAISQTLGIETPTLNRWILAAPMILLTSAQQLEKRVSALADLFSTEAALLGIPQHDGSTITPADAAAGDPAAAAAADSANVILNRITTEGWTFVARDPAQFSAYINKDPRVLLLSPSEVRTRLQVVQQELMCSWVAVVWLVMQHPSYLVVEPGSVTGWLYDVRHLCQMTTRQAVQLALCPQVFLTMSPEQVLLALQAFSQAHQISYVDSIAICSRCPLLLEQHPATTAAAMQQLTQLIRDQRLRNQLISAVPEMLLLGPRLQEHFVAAAATLALSSSQFGMMVKNQPSLWWVMVPRHVWQQTQQQQQQRTPQWIEHHRALALETLSAVRESDLRPTAIMQEAATLQPALLTLGRTGLQRHIKVLEQICSGCAYWTQQLRTSLPPQQLGRAILVAPTWRSRLRFMVESDLSRRVSLFELMGMSGPDFRRCFFQDYVLWRNEREQQHRRQLLRLWQQQQQQQSVSVWKQVGDQLQLEEQQQAAVPTSVTASSNSRSKLFGMPSGNAAANGSDADDDQLQSADSATQAEELEYFNELEAHVFYADSADADPSDIQWQQHASSSNEDSAAAPDGLDNFESYGQSTDHEQPDDASGIEQYPVGSNRLFQQQHEEEAQQQTLEWRGRRRVGIGGELVGWQEALVSKTEMNIMNMQQSGLELYGSWEGCLLRPSGSVQVLEQGSVEQASSADRQLSRAFQPVR